MFVLTAGLFALPVLHDWLGWTVKIQFFPALLAANFIVITVLILLTLIFGRVYCSVICPLGIFQDAISHIRSKIKKKNKRRFNFTPEKKWLRYGIFALFVALWLLGALSFAAILAPYSIFGRTMSLIFNPSEWSTATIAAIITTLTIICVTIAAWIDGRFWCNNICPVGTFLGLISRFSIFKIQIDTDKCVGCRLCGKSCKGSCINTDAHKIDYSRCVVCMDCIDNCSVGAIHYSLDPRVRQLFTSKASAPKNSDKPLTNPTDKSSDKPLTNPTDKSVKIKATNPTDGIDKGRRNFLTTTGVVAGTLALDAAIGSKAAEAANRARHRKGMAKGKEPVKRLVPVKPAGSVSLSHFSEHCIACQLCVLSCPEGVLKASTSLETFMQPEMDFSTSFCNPDCTVCSQVCPAGAILKITPEEKKHCHTGHAVVDYDSCLVSTHNAKCGNCARHCPQGAITMLPIGGTTVGSSLSVDKNKVSDDIHQKLYPSVDSSLCIACGACELYCPARPVSAIHVEGN